MNSMLEHWGVLTSVVAGAVAVLLYFVRNWRVVEELKANCTANQQKAEALAVRVDDYHVSAVAREEKLRLEMSKQAEAIRTEALQQRTEIRKEMLELVMKLSEKLTHIDKTLALVDERTRVLTDFTKDQQKRNEWADRILARLDNNGPV
ncbi:hypothetical protein [Hymenobacter rubripertinctus]|uniref:Uncharacterized protein n=1 Tax=Hymenobacter rubripertinctus TaxID=2029981 RepID=A0A418R8Z5_9BACT|nr:hypothetical protein [Hymenobacter rubripertinctus]RIY13761.1 hypothetical protein D0T11_01385 [Hymenobacter rubripertinctus]